MSRTMRSTRARLCPRDWDALRASFRLGADRSLLLGRCVDTPDQLRTCTSGRSPLGLTEDLLGFAGHNRRTLGTPTLRKLPHVPSVARVHPRPEENPGTQCNFWTRSRWRARPYVAIARRTASRTPGDMPTMMM